jgi:hypothetical protein
MLRFFNTIIMLVLISMLAKAQPEDDIPGPGPGRKRMIEKMEAMRVAFLTNRLDLTTEESTKFWPVYNEYSRKRMEIRRNVFEQRNKTQPELSEQQSNEVLNDQFETQEQELTLKKNYYEKFKAILPSQKLAKLEPAEMEFNHEVIRKLKERRERKMGRGIK